MGTDSDFADKAWFKEEQDHIPIIKINSVRSMASDQSPEREVIFTNTTWQNNVMQAR